MGEHRDRRKKMKKDRRLEVNLFVVFDKLKKG